MNTYLMIFVISVGVFHKNVIYVNYRVMTHSIKS